MPFPLLAFAAVVVKCACAGAAVGGACYCVKKFSDAYKKGQKTKRERLSLKGKSIEAAREDNKKAQAECEELRKKYEEQERENKRIEDELQNVKSKLNDPNIGEEERAK
jgi:septal ring factor EnvC (AmiA/AmiB activator)